MSQTRSTTPRRQWFQQSRIPYRVIALLGLILIVSVLAGCGGPGDSSGASTPGTDTSGPQATVAAMAMVMATATAEAFIEMQGNPPNSALEEAVQSYLARNFSTPYKDVEINIQSQDDAYATVDVHVMRRPYADKPWDEQQATLQFALVGEQWKLSKEESFVSLAGQATATAQAQVAQITAVVQAEIDFKRNALTAELNSVQMLSPEEGWAVGGNVILHYSGGSSGAPSDGPSGGAWTPQHWPGGELRDVDMLSAKDGWIVGGSYAPNGDPQYTSAVIIHYDGKEWNTVIIPDAGKGYVLTALDMISPTEGWAVGTDTILHYAAGQPGGGGKWERVKAATDAKNDLYDIKMLSATEGWAVGLNGVIMHYSGGQWSPVESGVHDSLFCITAVSPSDIWALGDSAHVTHYDGKAWAEQQMDLTSAHWQYSWHDASFSSPTDGWAIDTSNGYLVHFTNGKWQQLEKSEAPVRTNLSGPLRGLSGIAMLSKEEGWAIGAKGSILHYTNGKWTETKR